MPLFGSKFSPKSFTSRKSSSLSNLNLDVSERQVEFGVEQEGPIKVRLGSNEMVFADGHWIPDKESIGRGGSREVSQMKKQNVRLTEENNLLKLKLEILLDMLSEKTAEVHLQENEIEQLKRRAKQRK